MYILQLVLKLQHFFSLVNFCASYISTSASTKGEVVCFSDQNSSKSIKHSRWGSRSLFFPTENPINISSTGNYLHTFFLKVDYSITYQMFVKNPDRNSCWKSIWLPLKWGWLDEPWGLISKVLIYLSKNKKIRTFELFVVLTNFFESNENIEVKISYFNLEYKVLRH